MKKGLLIKNINELITCKGLAPKAGYDKMNDLGIINCGAIVVEDDIIKAVGTTSEILNRFNQLDYEIINASNKCVLPGFIDSHNHFVFSGYRVEEFSWRLCGDTYIDIMKKGGGIISTVRSTRDASLNELKELARKRLDLMLTFGITTVEGKSGYGLDKDTELKQLITMKELEGHAVEIIPTFLGAHAIPIEYKGRSNDYIEFIINEVLPIIADKKLANFCDVFCEKGIFSINESRKLLLAAQKLGLKSKLHADEIVQFGGAELAAEIGAVSADHLLKVSKRGMKQLAEKKVIATLLPVTAFSLRENFAPGRSLIDCGAAVALATDLNPGSCFTESIPLVIALASLNMKLTPAEIVTALTINAASAIDRADIVGSIEPNKQADILILEYPSHIYLSYNIGISIVETVIKKGNVVWKKY